MPRRSYQANEYCRRDLRYGNGFRTKPRRFPCQALGLPSVARNAAHRHSPTILAPSLESSGTPATDCSGVATGDSSRVRLPSVLEGHFIAPAAAVSAYCPRNASARTA
jgi:hypothetical protein